MTIDLSEFHDVFFEECFEGLDVMESGLLNLDQGSDIEEINAIFRAAHSIKGGGASFGFMDISSFTHVMETLLDEMRDNRRPVTRAGVDLLLESVDVLRDMINAAKTDEPGDQTRVGEVREKLESLLAQNETADHSPAADTRTSDATGATTPAAINHVDPPGDEIMSPANGWLIRFRPHAGMLQSGNEPLRIFRELQELGELRIELDCGNLPDLESIDPVKCYFSWSLTLLGDIERAVIEELFCWVTDECDLDISPLGGQSPVDARTGDGAGGAEQIVPEYSDDITTAPTAPCPSPETQTETRPDVAQPDTAQQKDRPKTAAGSKESGSIRVAINKVDELINMVGELVITQSMLSQVGSNLAEVSNGQLDRLRNGLTQLERNTRELQESVLQIRMLPISFSFSRFPRLVRDLSNKMGKSIELKMTGEHTEVDKTVLEKIGDPLVHLVRNSLDHGIEMPDVRKAAGKTEAGTLELCAYHEGGDIVIKVIDDGAGLNRERILDKAIEKGIVGEHEEFSDERIYNLIFAPGFSTAEQVSDVSGRGVGMDVVRRNVRDLGGNVSIASNEGAGSTVTIRLPLTLAILDGQLARIGNETYIVSLVSIVESLQMQPELVNSITGESELYRLRDEYIPIIRVNELFRAATGKNTLQDGLLMVVEADGRRVGLLVDDLMGQQQVVIKSLETNFRQIQGISGATILGDGTVALIIDVPGLIQRHFDECQRSKPELIEVA